MSDPRPRAATAADAAGDAADTADPVARAPLAVQSFVVESGQVVVPGAAWVYVWCEADAGARNVLHVGATTLHPAARAEKHLRDPDPAVGRIRARLAAAGGDPARPMSVHAIQVGPATRRAVVRAHVAWRLHASGRLSPHFCGDAPVAPPEPLTPDEEARVAALIAATG